MQSLPESENYPEKPALFNSIYIPIKTHDQRVFDVADHKSGVIFFKFKMTSTYFHHFYFITLANYPQIYANHVILRTFHACK